MSENSYLLRMDFQSAMETFAEAWVAANTQTPLTEAAEAQSLAGVPPSAAVAPPPTGGGTPSSTGGGASGVGGQPGAPRAPSSTPPSTMAAHNSPEEQDRSSSSCEAPPPTRPPPNVLAGKTLPVHCVVERVPSPQTDSQQPSVEVDSYAIVPSAALFADLVRTALTKLGYSPSEAICAKGVVQIKNWKPLAFDQITELPEATVGDMLSDLVQVATLRIRLYSIPSDPQMWTMDSVKTAVIQLLREMSQSKLAKICPLKQSLLSTIVNNKFTGKLGAEKCKEFGTWFMQYRQSSPATVTAFLDEDKPPQDGRMTFHSTTELPRMRDWFRQCPHPTNLQLQDFANQLNCESLRLRNKPKVTVNCLKNWWKNERQRERRVKRRSPGAVDEDSNQGSSAGSSSTQCPVPIKIAAVTSTSTPATPCAIHQHRSPPSPPALSQSPQPSQPQTTRPSAPSFSSNSPQNRPQHPVVTLATHEYGARAAAAMMPLRHLHHLHHHHHHSRFVPASSGGVVPAASSPAGDLVVALSTTSPS